jgi:hypothetical protein
MPVAPLLQRFVDEELTRTPAFIARVRAGTLQLLREPASSASERAHALELQAALQKQAELYHKTFADSLRALVEADVGHGHVDAGSDRNSSFGDLELMDESRVDVDIEISRAMQMIDSTAESELRELQTFTSTLCGQTHVSSESNPFRPLVYATALWNAACAVVTPQMQRATLLRLSSGVAAGLLKSSWAAACTRLESQGVEPGTYRTVVMAGAGSARGAPSIDVTRPGALGGLLSSMPTGNATDAPAGQARSAARPGVERNAALEAALAQLEDLLRALPGGAASGIGAAVGPSAHLDHHRPALVASTTAANDRRVIELLSRIFETMLSDTKLPAGLRSIVARLQVSALRLALNDPSMLDSNNHAVWHLMDRLGQIGASYTHADDPRLVAAQVFCASVAEDVAGTPAPDAALYRRALSRIDAFLAEQLQGQRRAADGAAGALEQAERRSILQQHFEQRLAEQMAPLRTTPGVRRFVTGTWSKVLAEAVLRFGEAAEPTQTYVRAVDELLWSLQIPDHPQSRQRLLSLLPVLLPRLRTGMELVELPRPEQQALFDELMVIHAEALRPGGRTTSAALTPEQIVQRMREEVVAEAPAARPFANSVIDLSSMETVPAEILEGGDARPGDEPSARVDRLRVGDRVRLFILGRWTRAQLLWRSDRGSFFLFAGDSPTRTHSITRRALERLAGEGLIQPIEVKPLLQRAVDHLMRELAVPA